ncbi:MAG: peptide deformylase [Proteobacteria bacterium]|nr:peptide deformylase [Pseudomonadota bacterium]
MALRPILVAPDPRLKRVSSSVPKVDDEIRALIDDLFETMYAAPGVGLAAPQVGVHKRLLVMDIAEKDGDSKPFVMINPAILERSESEAVYEEGCLSVPGYYADVARPDKVRVRYLDRDGAEQEIAAEGFLATCLQHEMDHLDGVLFVDRISALKRNMILRKLAKARKLAAAE